MLSRECAEKECRRAISLDPREANAHHWSSQLLVPMGRFQESLAESRLIYVGLGVKAWEFEWLERKYQEHSS